MMHVNYSVRKRKLDRYGCDSSGAYWGHGLPLYELEFRDSGINVVHTAHLRAVDRESAKVQAKGLIVDHFQVSPSKVCLWYGNV